MRKVSVITAALAMILAVAAPVAAAPPEGVTVVLHGHGGVHDDRRGRAYLSVRNNHRHLQEDLTTRRPITQPHQLADSQAVCMRRRLGIL